MQVRFSNNRCKRSLADNDPRQALFLCNNHAFVSHYLPNVFYSDHYSKMHIFIAPFDDWPNKTSMKFYLDLLR